MGEKDTNLKENTNQPEQKENETIAENSATAPLAEDLEQGIETSQTTKETVETVISENSAAESVNEPADQNNETPYEENSFQSTTEKQHQQYTSFDQPAGYSSYPSHEIPPEIKGWNWGAFSFNIFWGIGNKTYLPLLCLIPVFNIVWVFICGAKGNEWAWQSGNYRSVEEFKQVQKTWSLAGLAQFILSLAAFVILIFVVPIFFAFMSFFFERTYQQFEDPSSYNYDYYDDAEDYYYEPVEITEIPNWTEDIYNKIQIATSKYDLETDSLVYADGTTYEDVVALVGAPLTTTDYGDEIEAEWDTTMNAQAEDYAYILLTYDKESGMIINKYFSE